MTSTGCSLAGLAVGRAVPHYEHGSPVQGDHVRVRIDPGSTNDVSPGNAERVDGRYEEAGGDGLLLRTPDGQRRIASTDAREIEVAKGSEWKTGLLVGVLVDVVLLAALVAYASSVDYTPHFDGAVVGPIMR